MDTNNIWFSGIGEFYKHTHNYYNSTHSATYHCEIRDQEITSKNITEAFYKNLGDYRGTCELLYSGGLDSELVLKFLITQKIPTSVITLRLIKNGYPINIVDLYYSEKFCRENHLKQYFFDLDIEKFFNNFQYLNYLKIYKINQFHVASHFWLIEKCHTYPILGGDYPWPWITKPLLSPFKYDYQCYDLYMKEKSINGIGNMLGNSIDSVSILLNAHKDNFFNNFNGHALVPVLKQKIYNSLGLGKFELRTRSYGWDNLPSYIFNHEKHKIISYILPETKNSISWGNIIGNIIGSTTNYNDLF